MILTHIFPQRMNILPKQELFFQNINPLLSWGWDARARSADGRQQTFAVVVDWITTHFPDLHIVLCGSPDERVIGDADYRMSRRRHYRRYSCFLISLLVL